MRENRLLSPSLSFLFSSQLSFNILDMWLRKLGLVSEWVTYRSLVYILEKGFR